LTVALNTDSSFAKLQVNSHSDKDESLKPSQDWTQSIFSGAKQAKCYKIRQLIVACSYKQYYLNIELKCKNKNKVASYSLSNSELGSPN
jgi:hypothetical protein